MFPRDENGLLQRSTVHLEVEAKVDAMVRVCHVTGAGVQGPRVDAMGSHTTKQGVQGPKEGPQTDAGGACSGAG